MNEVKKLGRFEWRPNPKQSEFLQVPFSVREAFYGGGAGSGKSDVLLMYGIAHQLHLNPRFKQVLMRRTYPDLKKEIVGRSRDIYTKFGATFNQTDMVWTFPREDQFGSGMRNAGAQIFLGHCELETDVHNYDSMEITLFTPDELTLLSEWIYLYIGFERGRAPKDSGLTACIRAAGMPGGPGHNFVKKRFIDPCPEGGKIINGRGGNKRIYIHATYVDNQEHIDPTYGQALDGRPDAERQAKKFGDWGAYLGSVFDEFRDKNFPDEPSNALHVIEPREIPDWWPRIVVGDWGFRAMCWIGFAAISPSGRIYVYRELSFTKVKISDWGIVVRKFIETENVKLVKFCKSAGQDRGTEHTVQSQIEEALGTSIELTTNNAGSRIANKTLLHEYLRWKQKPIIPIEDRPVYDEVYALWLYRNKGPIEYKNYLNMFNDTVLVEDNIPRLQIFRCDKEDHTECSNCCPLVINAIKACSYDKPGSDGKLPEDVAEFDGDDPYDGLRYLIDAADTYVNESSEEFSRLNKQNQIINQYKQTQDMTAYYRNMRASESAQTNVNTTMIKTFHRRH